MRKHFLLGMFAAATMLFATSCQKEELGTEVTVSFALSQPGIATKAYSDGSSATKLTYAVYEAGTTDTLITSVREVSFNNKQATVNLRLVTGKSYDILFWADAGTNAPYTFEPATQTITVDYTDVASQDESRDAFFAAEQGLYIDGAISRTITLKRPFAQLNIGTTDTTEAAVAGFVPTHSSVAVSNVYSSLNLLDGTVSGPVSNLIFDTIDIPTNESFPVNGAKYLSMNYLLVSADKELVDVDFFVTDGTHDIPREFISVPVQRNYRTNIYGKLLTSQTDFTIVINENYEVPDWNKDDVIFVENDSVLNAMSSLPNQAIIILAPGRYTLPSTAQRKTLTFIGDGNADTKKSNGDPATTTIECNANSGSGNLYGSTVTFENLTIETDDETYRGFTHVSGATYKNCIINNQLTLYTEGDAIEFDSCVFNATSNYNFWSWGSSAIFTDCTFNCTGKAALVYGGGVSTVTFNSCTFNDNGGIDGKAAIETGNDYDATYNIHINTCTVNGFDVNSVSQSNIWGNKSSMTADKLNVFINGTEVY